jgi:hypothetical protein
MPRKSVEGKAFRYPRYRQKKIIFSTPFNLAVAVEGIAVNVDIDQGENETV